MAKVDIKFRMLTLSQKIVAAEDRLTLRLSAAEKGKYRGIITKARKQINMLDYRLNG